MDQELIAYLDKRFRENSLQMEGLRGEFETLRQEMVSRFEKVDGALRQAQDDIRQNSDDIRHTQILVEAMRSDLQGVAEGVLSNTQRIDALREEMKQEVGEVRKTLALSHKDLSQRVCSLEEWRQRSSEDPAPRLRKKAGKKS